jgi:serine/threonine-protein kinase
VRISPKDQEFSVTEAMPSFNPALAVPWLGTTFAGAYFVEAVLGEGSMGQVLLARDIHLDRAVAIKVLKPDTAERFQVDARFRREARMLSRLSHPNIVNLFSFGSLDDGTGYIVMERIDGHPLSVHCGRESLLPHDVLVAVVEQICLALAAAHLQGIVHRDVKPSNVLLSRTDGAVPHVTVLDFGLAKPLEAGADNDMTWDALATTVGAAVGTPAYMSPEQACGDPVDGRSDIYGLACVVTELLTGSRPYDEVEGSQLIMAHINEPARLPSQLLDGMEFEPGCPVDLVMAQALEKDPKKRFQDVLAFAQALRDALSAEPSTTAPTPPSPTSTGAFATIAAGMSDCSEFGSTVIAGAVVDDLQPAAPSLRTVAVLLLEVDQLWREGRGRDEELIGDDLAIAAARVRDAIEAEGGLILGGLVGGATGLFNAGVNRTEAVESAVQAALTIRRHLALLQRDPLLGDTFEPRIRLGIEIGSLVVGTSTTGEPVAFGRALTGARAQVSSAGPDEIRLSRRCYRLVRGQFCYRGASGFDSQVGPAVLGRTQASTERADTELYGATIPYIGRERELSVLQTVLDGAMDGLPGGRFLILGPQGMGKTRLVSEAIESVTKDDRLLTYDSGRCTMSGHTLSYDPFVQALRARAGIVHDDDPDGVSAKVEGLIDRWLLKEGEDREDVEDLSQFLRAMLELEVLDSSPAAAKAGEPLRGGRRPDHRAVHLGFADYYGRILERGPVLLCIDDFMYASVQTRELVRSLVGRFWDRSFTVVLCARNEAADLARESLAVADAAPHSELTLTGLSFAVTQALVRGVLRRVEDLSDDLVMDIARLAGGVPHIVVEAIFDLVESGVIRVTEEQWFVDPHSQIQVRLPESAEQLLRDRVSRLSPLQRDLVQIAAVAGDVFWPDLLQDMALSPATVVEVESLVERGFFAAQPGAIIDGIQGYTFAQAAVRESVYRHTPGSQRRRLHGEIAAWLADRTTRTAHPIDALIGTHYRLADQHDRALPYLVRCANRAVSLQATDEAIRHILDCLELLPHLDDEALGPPERESLTRDLGGDLADCYIRLDRCDEAETFVGTVLAPGGALAGTEAVANSRLLLARADALAKLGRSGEARTAYRSVDRLLAGRPNSPWAFRARAGAALSQWELEGGAAAQRALEEALSSVDGPLLEHAEVAGIVSRIETELASIGQESDAAEVPAAPI